MIAKLLVYGTLRPGNPENTARIPKFKMFDLGWYPGVIRTDRLADSVVCEMIDVKDEEHLARLDAYEGCNGNTDSCLYHRVNLATEENQDPIYLYLYNGGGSGEEVVSGDWLKHKDQEAGSNSRLVSAQELT